MILIKYSSVSVYMLDLSQPPAFMAEACFIITRILVTPSVAVKGTFTVTVLVPDAVDDADANTISPASRKSPSLFQSIQA